MTGRGDAEPRHRVVVNVDPEVADIVPIFLEHVQEDVKKMRVALDRGDYETVRILGHSLKGAGGGFGFDSITDMGCSLEAAAKRQDTEEVITVLGKLAAYVARVDPVFE